MDQEPRGLQLLHARTDDYYDMMRIFLHSFFLFHLYWEEKQSA